jgi:hypothetical protein
MTTPDSGDVTSGASSATAAASFVRRLIGPISPRRAYGIIPVKPALNVINFMRSVQ